MSRFRRLKALLRAVYEGWQRDNAMMLAAAVAFYATFSLAPLLMLLMNGGALLFGEQGARNRLLDFVASTVGAKATRAVERLMLAAAETDAGATAVSVVLLFVAASAMFRHLKVALNLVLDVPTKEERGFLRFLWNRVFAVLVVVAGIVLLLSALGVTTAFAWLRTNSPELLAGGGLLWRIAETLVSFAVLAVVFGAVLKFVPDISLKWRHVGIGAALAAFLFVAGQFLIGLYVGHARPGAAYGAAGSVVLLLLYVYFSVAVLLTAAELTEVISREDAEFRGERLRAQHEGGYSPHKNDAPP